MMNVIVSLLCGFVLGVIVGFVLMAAAVMAGEADGGGQGGTNE